MTVIKLYIIIAFLLTSLPECSIMFLSVLPLSCWTACLSDSGRLQVCVILQVCVQLFGVMYSDSWWLFPPSDCTNRFYTHPPPSLKFLSSTFYPLTNWQTFTRTSDQTEVRSGVSMWTHSVRVRVMSALWSPPLIQPEPHLRSNDAAGGGVQVPEHRLSTDGLKTSVLLTLYYTIWGLFPNKVPNRV